MAVLTGLLAFLCASDQSQGHLEVFNVVLWQLAILEEAALTLFELGLAMRHVVPLEAVSSAKCTTDFAELVRSPRGRE